MYLTRCRITCWTFSDLALIGKTSGILVCSDAPVAAPPNFIDAWLVQELEKEGFFLRSK
jgi:hypothetical protein